MTRDNSEFTLIFDIGKTNIKLHVLNGEYHSVFSKQMANTVDHSGIYPSAKVGEIWQWFCESLKEVGSEYNITKLTITTHGATAALINRTSTNEDGLTLPVLDYEYIGISDQSPEYDNARPDYFDTFSPSLPAGLNLGRQLYWLKENYPEQYAKTTDILMYPQYWVWRFTGERSSEITSLGCHTDLWSLTNNDLSALVDNLESRELFPELKPAWTDCGTIKASLAEELGLNPECKVYSGLHDSNASFLRYRLAQDESPFTVISTGTWTILMASKVSLENLNPEKDMLANIDALGCPIACARFMGGREFEAICEQAGSWLGEQFEQTDIQNIIDQGVFALPDFSDGSGPFGGNESKFIGSVDKVSGMALATLYSALMIDYQLEMLAAQGSIYIEGAFLKNPLLCGIVNQLRAEQEVLLSLDSTGTVMGAAYLTNWEQAKGNIDTKPAMDIKLDNLLAYKAAWLKHIEENQA